MSRLIAITNKSTLLSGDDCKRIAHALQKQIAEDVAPAWGMLSVGVVFYPISTEPPDFGEPLVMLNDTESAGALGYHDVTPEGKPYSKVFVKPILANGGGIFRGNPWSVVGVAGHEAIEATIDRTCNEWCDGPVSAGGDCYAKEGCDAVEAHSYQKTLDDGTVVDLTNFLYPEYFNPIAPKGSKLDHMGVLTDPFTIAPGGYQLVRYDPENPSQQFGLVAPPQWRRDSKDHPASRTARRMVGK